MDREHIRTSYNYDVREDQSQFYITNRKGYRLAGPYPQEELAWEQLERRIEADRQVDHDAVWGRADDEADMGY